MKTMTTILLKKLPLAAEDVVRQILEFTEELGERAEGLERAELIKLLRRVIRAGAYAIEQAENTVSFEEAARASIEDCKERRATTVRDLRYFVGRMLRVEGLSNRPLRAITTQECRRILQQAFGSSVHSYRKGRAILHSIFSYGIRWEWCASNPVSRIEVPRVKEKNIRPLSLPEIRRLESTAAQPAHRDMQLQLMLY